MKQILNIWMQPVYARLNLYSSRSLVLILCAVPVLSQILVFALVTLKGRAPDPLIYLIALGISLAAVVFILLYGWFILLAMNLGLQYSPANAQLVPGLKRRMQLALGLPIVVTGVIASLIFSVIARQLDTFPFFVTVAFTSFFVLTVRSQWAVIPFVLSFQIPVYIKNSGLENPIFTIEKQLGIPMQLQYFVLGVLILWGLLFWFFNMKGETHFKMYQRCKNYKGGMQGFDTKENSFSLGMGFVYFRMMQSAVERALGDKKGEHRGSLTSYVLGPRTHWTSMYIQTALIVVCGSVFLWIVGLFARNRNEFWEGFGLGFGSIFGGMFVLGLPLMFLVQIFFALHKSSKEQALLCLAPNAGTRSQVDTHLMSFILRQFFLMYLVAVAASVGLVMWVGHFDLKGAVLVLYLSFLMPCGLALVAPHARMRSASDSSLAKWCAVAASGFILSLSSLIFFDNRVVFVYAVVVTSVTALEFKRRLLGLKSQHLFPVGSAA